jgi:hypothetical protein
MRLPWPDMDAAVAARGYQAPPEVLADSDVGAAARGLRFADAAITTLGFLHRLVDPELPGLDIVLAQDE